MSDIRIIQQIQQRIPTFFNYTFIGDRCVELYLSDVRNVYKGSLRYCSEGDINTILKLLSELTSLETLDLSHNKLNHLPEHLTSLINLKKLILVSNNLNYIPQFLTKIKNLNYLNIGSNQLLELPLYINDFENIEHLLLHKNIKIKHIKNLQHTLKLKTLNLYFINLHTVTENIFKLHNLQTLVLWNTKKFANNFSVFKNLEYLTLCGTPGLRSLPPGFCELSNLRMARVYQNNLLVLPKEIELLQQLTQLSVYQNNLTYLPDEICNLKKLEKLNVGWNNITDLPLNINKMSNLKWLGVFQNPLNGCYTTTLKGLNVIFNRPFTS